VIDTVRPMEYSPLEAYRQMDTVIAPGGLVRREPLLATGGWDPGQYYMPDFLLWMKVGLAGPVVRVDAPVASWRRHEGGLSEQSGFGRVMEFLQLVEMGEELLDLPADAYAIRAEAFRNALIQAAFFTGGSGPPPGERFGTIDLGKPGSSALASGLAPTDWPDQRADEAADLWRELARLTLELRRARSSAIEQGQQPPGAGLRAARDLLRRAGVLAAGGEDPPAASGERDVRMDLLEAAVACEGDIDPAESRFLVVERDTPGVTDAEFEELNTIGFGVPAERLRRAVEDRRRKLEELISARGVRNA
jgi:hypothetical protein